MDQTELKQWEWRCIQEEPPECTAACPIHVDARAFIAHVRVGRWNEGWQVLNRAMPLTGILSRICDAPCERRCKRQEAGAPIRIGALERTCANLARGVYRSLPLPSKNKRVAVLGGGLSSLTVAWDLSRKGYAVTVWDAAQRVATGLEADYPALLTIETIAAELSVLQKWGVRFETAASMQSASLLRQMLGRFDAVYIGLDGIDSVDWELERAADGSVPYAVGTHATSRPGIFAGGAIPSIILRVAQGRWAATAMDRTLQKVSLTAGREKEGPHATRLFTSLQGVAARAAVSMTDPRQGYTADEAMAEAERCLQCECLECVKVCRYLEAFGAYPRKYAREIYNNESIVMGTRTANTLINSCSLCGLCETVCPEDFAMQDLCLQTRQSMVRNGKMPPSAHEFALEDMGFSQGNDFFLARHAPGTVQSSHLFFPGCQLCASLPHHVEALYEHLRTRIAGGVGLMLGCCGAPAFWAGREAEGTQVLGEWRRQWERLGRPRLILACSSCHRMLRAHWPEAPIQSVWEALETAGLPEAAGFSPTAPLAVHDPCTTRDVPAIQACVRRLLASMNVAMTELPLSRTETECCGYGGLMQNANPDMAAEVARRRGTLSDNDFVAYCAMCRDNLSAAGKRTLHLLDLIFPGAGQADPAARQRPGWSRRRENRARLKAGLLARVWGEGPTRGPDFRHIALKISAEVRERLDRRRILMEDVRQAIAEAEAGGPKLRHPDTGRFKAACRPRHVTFWVEYVPIKDGFEIFNAYAHRMKVEV